MKESRFANRGKRPVMGRIKVGLTGLSPGAGVSFLTSVLAGFLADVFRGNPSVLELGNPCLYEAMGLSRHFSEETFRFYSRELAAGVNPRALQNRYAGVNWLVRSPSEIDRTERLEQVLRLVNNAEGDFILCDLSGFPEEELLWQAISEMDSVILTVDPLPSRLLLGQAVLDGMRDRRVKPILLVNKDNGGVRRRELKRFLAGEDFISIPFLPPEPIYRAEYACHPPFRTPELRRLLEEPMGQLCHLLTGREEVSGHRQTERHRTY